MEQTDIDQKPVTDIDQKPVTADFQLVDVSTIANSLQELSSAERYAVNSFMFLFRVRYQKERKPLPPLFAQTRKLVRDVIELVDQ